MTLRGNYCMRLCPNYDFMHLFRKILDKMANSIDPEGAVWSESALFANVILSYEVGVRNIRAYSNRQFSLCTI